MDMALTALTGLLRGKKQREEATALQEEQKQAAVLQKEMLKIKLEEAKAAQQMAAQKQAFIERIFPSPQSTVGLGQVPQGPQFSQNFGGEAEQQPQGPQPVDTSVIDMMVQLTPLQQQVMKELTGIDVPGAMEATRKRQQDEIANSFRQFDATLKQAGHELAIAKFLREGGEFTQIQTVDADGNTVTAFAPKYGGIPAPVLSKPGPKDIPLSITDLEGLRNPKTGQRPVIGTTPRQAAQEGFVPQSAGQETQRVAIAGTLALLDTMEGLADKVFKANTSIGRFGEVPRAMIAKKLQNDPNVALFESLKEGSLAKFIKGLGDVGAMTESDLERARALVPNFYPIPDTRDVAMGKLNQLRKLFQDIEQRSMGVAPTAAPAASPTASPGAAAQPDSNAALKAAEALIRKYSQ